MGTNCGALENFFKQNTYEFQEVIENILMGFTKKKSLLNQTNLSSPDMTYTQYGQYHTVDIEAKMSQDDKNNQLFIALSYDLSYQVFIRDKLFFYMDETSVSSTKLDINPSTTLGGFITVCGFPPFLPPVFPPTFPPTFPPIFSPQFAPNFSP